MTESTLHPASSRDTMIRTVCQVAMWAIVGLKAIWLAMALDFVGLQWPVLLFGGALLSLAVATWFLGTGNRTLGIALTWMGVIAAIAAGYFGGSAPSALTDRIHDQYRIHMADFVFLAVAHVQFWVLGSTLPKPIVPANV